MSYPTTYPTSTSGYGPLGSMYRYAINNCSGIYDNYSNGGNWSCGPCGSPNGWGCGNGINYGYNTCYPGNSNSGSCGFNGNCGLPPRNVSWATSGCGLPTAFNYGGYC